MIQKVQKPSIYNGVNNAALNSSQTLRPASCAPKADTVSFKGELKEAYIDGIVLDILKRLQNENPVIGFKGDGFWLLPNLRKSPGQKFNLYMPDGQQLSYQKSMKNDYIIFSLKKNDPKEKAASHIKLPFRNKNNENEKLLKTKNERVLKFRVNLEDDKYGSEYKAGKVEKLTDLGGGAYEETALFSDKEIKEINKILKICIKNLF